MKGSWVLQIYSEIIDDKNGDTLVNTRLYVGNLSYQATDQDLKNIFAQFGGVKTAEVVMDRATDRSKGFAFVEMSSTEEAQKALALNGTDLLGRKIQVSEAKPRKSGGQDGRRGNFDSERRQFGDR